MTIYRNQSKTQEKKFSKMLYMMTKFQRKSTFTMKYRTEEFFDYILEDSSRCPNIKMKSDGIITFQLKQLPVQLYPFKKLRRIGLVVCSKTSNWVEFSSKTASNTNLRSLFCLFVMSRFIVFFPWKKLISSCLGSKTRICLSTTWTTLWNPEAFSFVFSGRTRTTTFMWWHRSSSVTDIVDDLDSSAYVNGWIFLWN